MKEAKLIILIILLIFPLFVKSQNIPNFDETKIETEDSNFIKKIIRNYKTAILYKKDCYWSKAKNLVIVGQRKNKWKIVVLEAKLKKNAFPEEDYTYRRRKIKLNKTEVDTFFKTLSKNDFWALNKDSLRTQIKKLNDSMSTLITITDGCSDIFHLISDNRHRQSIAYMPEFYQSHLPNYHRYNFIKCRDYFNKFINKKWKTLKPI